MEALGHATIFGLLVAVPQILTLGSRQGKQLLTHSRLTYSTGGSSHYPSTQRRWRCQCADWDKPFSGEYILAFSYAARSRRLMRNSLGGASTLVLPNSSSRRTI